MSEKREFLTVKICQLLQVAQRGNLEMDTATIARQLNISAQKIKVCLRNLTAAGHVIREKTGERWLWIFCSMPSAACIGRRKSASVEEAPKPKNPAPSRQPFPFVELRRNPFEAWQLCLRDLPETSQSAAKHYTRG